jgi:predicted outer membrane protein
MKKLICYLPRLILTASVIITGCISSSAQSTAGMSSRGSGRMSDTAFISKNIMDNMMEIQLSEMGKAKSTDAKIKNLAQQMVTDHTQILNDLQKAARERNMTTMMGANMSGNWNSGSGSGSTGSGVGTSGSASNATATSGSRAAAASASGSDTTGSGNGTMGRRTRGNRNGTNGSATVTSDTAMAASGMSTSGSDTTGTRSTSGTGMGTSGTGSGSTGASSGTSGSGMSGMNGGMTGQNMASMQTLQNATGAEFNNQFVSQMLAMHEAKLAELQTAATTLTDPELKLMVTKAIPKIRMHRDMLLRINKEGTTSGTNGTTPQ